MSYDSVYEGFLEDGSRVWISTDNEIATILWSVKNEESSNSQIFTNGDVIAEVIHEECGRIQENIIILSECENLPSRQEDSSLSAQRSDNLLTSARGGSFSLTDKDNTVVVSSNKRQLEFRDVNKFDIPCGMYSCEVSS